VLAVDGDQRRAALANGLHEQRAGHDQRFLVREQDPLARERCREAGTEARGTDDRRHDRVDVGVRCNVAQRLLAGQNFCRRANAAELRGQERGRCWIDDDGKSRSMLQALLAQPRDVAARRECENLVTIAMTLEHVQRVQTDAAGRAEHGDAHRGSHRSNPRRSRPIRKTGAAAVTLSTRSSSPP
jgi:hypothetical protein